MSPIKKNKIQITPPENEFKQFKGNANIYKQMFQFSPFSIIIHDMEMNIIDVNKMTTEQFGYSRKELLEMTVFELHAEEEMSNSSRVMESFKTEENLRVETKFSRKDGSVFIAEATPFKYKHDEKLLIHVYIQDITERKEHEKQIVNAMEKAEESDRLKSAFLTSISHEVRTPMNAILGFIRLLRKPSLNDEEKKQYIDIIENSGTRLLNLINDIINISKIEAGLVKPKKQIIEVNSQIEYLYMNFRPEVESRGMKLVFSRPLPTNEAVIETDPEKLMAVLTNLIKNAIKYSHQGIIDFGYEAKGDFLEFYVKDTGIGIPEGRLEAIFKHFEHADYADKEAQQGAGLGLAISKSYVEMLGGKLRVESNKGEGSAFYFTIPYTTGENSISWITSDGMDEILTNQEISKSTGLKILIAEDDDFSYSLLKLMLKEVSGELLHVENGAEAIEIVRKNPDIDLILMDIKMPGMSGYEATKRIREFNQNVIIIAQTAYVLMGDKEKAIKSGCNAYLTKPLNEEDLHSVMQNHFIN